MELQAPSLLARPTAPRDLALDDLVNVGASAFQAFLLVDRDLSPVTVDHRLRSMRHMAATGFSWPTFCSSAPAALFEGRRWLAEKKLAAGRSTLHNYELVLNDVARYQALTDAAFQGVWFQHTKPLYGHPDPYSPAELAALAGYRCADAFVERRRRALIWLALHTCLRRSELARIQLRDLDEDLGVLHVRRPAKGGKPRALPMPRETWSARRPLAAYLRARSNVLCGALDVEGLWVSRAGHELGSHMLGKETADLSRELGFAVSFNRFRRTGTTQLFRRGVGLPTVQYLLGHHNPRSTLWYYEPTVDDIRRDLARCRVHGFAPAPGELGGGREDKPGAEVLVDVDGA